MTATNAVRVLDASALVELTQGHPEVMKLIDRAHFGQTTVVVPALAVLEAQAAVQMNLALWDHVLGLPGLRDLDLSPRTAAYVGDLAAPRLERNPLHTPLMAEQMAAQVAYEAIQMNAVVTTRIPGIYRGYAVSLMEL
ncbi:hypothetical protein [Actinoplanes sp. L3-i22]|uniref:hypothetical protein n=1 Tax=Actinoplanes sp. L3-i22 TaxID=2836373 RepID=UPI001C786D5A|nr:hypothetical protein [Actinoplanes sp. L3-i22]BCY10118.1 hypothetical protein L3i22_052060 [Actinoplanes sp. L3-i22]